MKRFLANNKVLMIVGLASVLYIVFYGLIFFLEADGCTVLDVPDLVADPSRLSKLYCGDVEDLAFLPVELNGILSIIMNTLLPICFVTALFLPIGILRALYGRFSTHLG